MSRCLGRVEGVKPSDLAVGLNVVVVPGGYEVWIHVIGSGGCVQLKPPMSVSAGSDWPECSVIVFFTDLTHMQNHTEEAGEKFNKFMIWRYSTVRHLVVSKC
ncbi:hypothetical protein ATANTOWER_027015 [Ataeniobius toweri]|uniref:Uncharacterized protein n=1 Tax=Ataeniobius toweri TaxID=208326 RepID=A0ABU7BHT9_9TELE|nr:hypothetical protein [Ataeniobius toweri]